MDDQQYNEEIKRRSQAIFDTGKNDPITNINNVIDMLKGMRPTVAGLGAPIHMLKFAVAQLKDQQPRFKSGDQVLYAQGLTFTFVGVDPEDLNFAYCQHPVAIDQNQPILEYKRVDRLPMDRLTLKINNEETAHS